ncbi:hypothetical protein DFQ28_009313 [Apophysomyces sp. BC1034]|nr:hypothetical protein DFQ28_009313 [Apophysomyces sp. BC1034]
MAKIIVVTSGKGGVGKTTTSASFASGLALRGHKTAVIDFDVGLRNLDLIMGCERRVVYDLINVIQGEANLHQALIKDKKCDPLYIMPASQTRDKDALTLDGVEKVINELIEMGFEYIVCDSPAGIESGALMAMHFADEALIVTNPEVSSVRDSDRILGILASKTRRAIEGKDPVKEHLMITRYNPKRVSEGEMLSLDDIQEILRIPLIGVIPESESVLHASNQGVPAVHLDGTDVADSYKDVIARFLGEQKPLRYIDYQKPGLLQRGDMSILSFLLGEKRKSASVAKERLQLIIAHERAAGRAPADYLPALQRELVAVISKYVKISNDDIKVQLERLDDLEVLEVKIEIPQP